MVASHSWSTHDTELCHSDPSHAACFELLERTRDPLVVPSPLLVELDWLGDARGVPVLDATLASVENGSIEVIDLSPADSIRIRELCWQYQDLGLGMVDASVVAVAERLGKNTIATLDHGHFSVVRPRHVASFTLVPSIPQLTPTRSSAAASGTSSARRRLC